MRTALLLFVGLVNALFACSGSNQQSNGATGGLNSVAGSLGTGSSSNSGGSTTTGTTGATYGTGGVATAAGGRTGTGGGTGTGGSNGVGGSAVVGGAPSSGGAKATGGTTGVNNATGGTITSAGGATSSGGTTSKGGTNTGGTTPKGGASALGGSPSMGGTTSDAGSPSTGGTTTSGGASSASGALYVSPTGDDSNPGTLAEPLKTIAKARDLVRTMNGAMTTDITVYLRGGTYPQTSSLTFANADSGSGGFYVKYMAYNNERPLITGGQPIKGWKVSDATNNIYSASAGTTAFRQLYVNGVKAIRARSPNLLANNVANFNRLSGWDKTANNLQVPTSAVASWNNLTKVEMHVNIAWGDSTLRIASITNSGTTALVKFQSPESPLVFVRPNPNMAQVGWGSGRAYYFENALEFLDQAGEW